MSTVLAFVEQEDGALSKLSAETVTFARQLAERAGSDLHAAAIGEVGEAALGALRELGAGMVHQITHELLDDYAPDAWAEAIVQLGDGLDLHAMVGPGGDRGAEIFAHIGARTDQPLAANCIDISPTAEGWELTRVRWGGVLLEDAELSAEVALLTVAPHQTAASPADDAGDAQLETFHPVIDEALTLTRVREIATLGGGISLATAPVVVSGGRGVGSADGFAILEELAELVGGAVGCSRVATNNGWRSHNDQVGQTGTRVAPDLYIACGISGATQHWVGCMSSKRILAINTDAEAPMVTRAHYAVLGDLHEFLPALVAEVRARKGA